MRTAAFVSSLLLLAACSRDGVVHFTGDDAAVGAEVLVDGQRVTEMQAQEYRGTTSKDPVVIERERKISETVGPRPGEKLAFAQVRVPKGRHEITVRGRDGATVSTSLDVGHEAYVSV